MRLLNSRITFKNSPIHILEKFTFRDIEYANQQFQQFAKLPECLILQTCNRVELFATSDESNTNLITDAWSDLTNLTKDDFTKNMNVFYDRDVLEHLLHLVTGLDSMVIGEEQILGQIKDAVTLARKSKTLGTKLNLLFDRTIRSGTAIRNKTHLNHGGLSVGSMAVKLVEENIDHLRSKKILLIGTGEVSTLVAKSLLKRHYDFFVTSRTLQRAETFCTAIGGTAISFEDILIEFNQYDVIFVATTASYFLITYERIANTIKDKDTMMIMDLSTPRTVDDKVATLNGVRLMNLDQIAEMIERNTKNKSQKAKLAYEMVLNEVPTLNAMLRRHQVEPIITQLFLDVDEIRESELQRAITALGEKDPEKIKILENMSKSIAEGIISSPVSNLRLASENNDQNLIKSICKLFGKKPPVTSKSNTTKS